MAIQWRSFLMKFLFAITNIVYLNILWLLFSLLGLVIFGFAPASVALIKSLEGFHLDADYIPIKIFFTYYKESFKKTNQLQLIYLSAILSLFFSSRILITLMNVTGIIPIFYLTVMVILVFMNSMSLQSFLFYPYMKIIERFKLSLFLFMRYPLSFLPIIFTGIGCYTIISIKSAFFIFIGASLPIAIIAYLQGKIFNKFIADFPDFGVLQ